MSRHFAGPIEDPLKVLETSPPLVLRSFAHDLNWELIMPREVSLSDSRYEIFQFGTILPIPQQRLLLLFDDNEVKMARKPGKKQKENPVG